LFSAGGKSPRVAKILSIKERFFADHESPSLSKEGIFNA